ncbi:prephenate dehydrogenase [Staphylococcus massiliensis]|uniref:prephenate dehydrogenase n=1 Tax=Staphylococcus massiliensis TaxID=555791 RepID=UPI00370D386D
MTHILFVGLGLIGGSLASNIKHHHNDVIISAYDYNASQLDKAYSIGIIDHKQSHYEQAVAKADIIFYATPVSQTVTYLKTLPSLETKPGLIVTDTGSTKNSILAFEQELLEHDIHLVGGHPMAGSHKSGILNAKKHLFENAYYMLTYNLDANANAAKRIEHLLQHTLAQFITVNADEHDFVTGVVSHFPHIIAASLVHLNKRYANESQLVPLLAAGGFRDITRIASSNAEMWRDITLENKNHLIKLMKNWQQQMAEATQMLEDTEPEALYQFFEQAKTYRDALPSQKKGAVLSSFDLFVEIPDRPGMISEVTKLLSLHNISISNLRILETREDIYGALRVSFKSPEDRQKGIEALHQFETYLP